MTTVVAAVIERDGRILICQRKPDQLHPLKWEFPGGKVEAGESAPGALLRELREELDIAAGIGDEITRYEYRYPERKPILLIFYRVTRFTGEPRNLVFERVAWERPEALPAYDFLEGDVEFVRRLAAGGFTPERRRPESAP
ncbi:MAG: (deoxy)nucleoside triphosphate pyrophosphohydrolase [Bryobacteraceae bacterium]